jgi:cold shock CspA family protein
MARSGSGTRFDAAKGDEFILPSTGGRDIIANIFAVERDDRQSSHEIQRGKVDLQVTHRKARRSGPASKVHLRQGSPPLAVAKNG